MAADLPGLGTKLQCKPVSSAAYVDIAQIVSIEAGGIDAGQRNPTTLDSTLVEKKPIILDAGELTVEVNWDPNDSVHRYLYSACTAKSVAQPFKLIWNDGNATGAMLEVAGYVQTIEFGGLGVEDTATAKVTIPLTALTSFASGS
jgi:hypothetical protein